MATIVLPFTLLDDGMGGPISEMPEVEAFSFGDFALADDGLDDAGLGEDRPIDDDAIAPIGADGPAVSAAPAADDDIDVPTFMAAAAFLVQPDEAATDAPADGSAPDESEPEPAPTWNAAPRAGRTACGYADAGRRGPGPDAARRRDRRLPRCHGTGWRRGGADDPVHRTGAGTGRRSRTGRVRGTGPRRFEVRRRRSRGRRSAPSPTASSPKVEVAEPLAAAAVDKGAFAAMLHATQASAPIESKEKPDPEPLVEPAGPQPEPVQAFVQNLPELAPEVADPETAAFVAAPIQDDLLPQLPRRGRRGRGAEAPAPAVPDQVLRIAAAQTSVEPEPEPAVALVAEAEMVAAVPESAPPLPRRELDAEPVAPPPRPEPASIPAGAEAARPNYELFAAFRAATDQGRADAVRRGDGGGA